ncbi:MAG: CapA family protein [Clostridiales bacterium]|nr:CapA family protein [Clostridiales bacterium]
MEKLNKKTIAILAVIIVIVLVIAVLIFKKDSSLDVAKKGITGFTTTYSQTENRTSETQPETTQDIQPSSTDLAADNVTKAEIKNTGYEYSLKGNSDAATLTISFVGDCMFASNHGKFGNGSFNKMAQEKPPEYFLRNFIDMFGSDDLTVANCEGVLSDSELTEKTVTTKVAFWFKGPSSNANIFKAGNVDLASVVNNHSHDFGQQGSDDTETSLEAAGIIPGRRDNVSYITVKGRKIGVFCCSLYSYSYLNDILVKVEEMERKQCDIKVIYFHGGIENATAPEEWKVRSCHELIDAGADIIVGSHPHVLQPVEFYKGKPIVYSLGNFCFGGNMKPPRNTAVYQAVFDLDRGEIGSRKDIFIPCTVYSGEVNNYQPDIIKNEAEKSRILKFMNVE